jgi:hypothetical protein
MKGGMQFFDSDPPKYDYISLYGNGDGDGDGDGDEQKNLQYKKKKSSNTF